MSLLETCITVVWRGLRTHPSKTWMTSKVAPVWTIAVATPTRAKVVPARRYTGTSREGTNLSGCQEDFTYDEDFMKGSEVKNRDNVLVADLGEENSREEERPSRLKRCITVKTKTNAQPRAEKRL